MNSPYPLPFTPLYLPWRAWSRFAERHPDVGLIISNDPYGMGLIAWRESGLRTAYHVTVAHTDYNDYGNFYPKFLPTWVRTHVTRHLNLLWVRRFYNHRVDRIIAPSRWMADNIQDWEITTPISVIPTAVPRASQEEMLPENRESFRKRHGVPAHAKLVMYGGRIEPEKNLRLLLDAICELESQGEANDLYFFFIGPGKPRFLTSHPAYKRIRFLGAMPHCEYLKALATADLFVLPSLTDTQALVVAEAIMREVRVVVTNQGGPQESVTDGVDGIICDPNPLCFAKAMLQALALPPAGPIDASRRIGDFLPERIARLWKELIDAIPSRKPA